MLILAVVLELTAIVATNDVVALRRWLIVRLTVLRLPLIVATTALVVALMTVRSVLAAIGTPVLRLIGQRLRSDTDTQLTNTGQTPDARLHALPHCGLEPVRKTGKAQAGSATGYQSRNLFIEGGT